MDIKEFLEYDKQLAPDVPRMLTGDSGIGKTAVIKQIAAARGKKVIYLPLHEYEPPDIIGLPEITTNKHGNRVTTYAQPWWWPEEDNCIIFLDELDRCNEDMQPVAMQLMLERSAGGRELPAGVIIYSACNGSKYMTKLLEQAVVTRLVWVEFKPTVTEWLSWASTKTSIHPCVPSYIRSNNLALDTPRNLIGEPNCPVTCRRAWDRIGKFLSSNWNNLDKEDVLKIQTKLEPFIGLQPALQFSRWLKDEFDIIDPVSVFTQRFDSKKIDVLQVAHIVGEVAEKFMERTEKEQYNALKFFMDAGEESFSALYAALPSTAAPKLAKYPDVDEFIMSLMDKWLERDQSLKEK